MSEFYRFWHIEFNPKPIPDRSMDWDFWHDDYEADDYGDNGMSGYAASPEDCKALIDEYYDSLEADSR